MKILDALRCHEVQRKAALSLLNNMFDAYYRDELDPYTDHLIAMIDNDQTDPPLVCYRPDTDMMWISGGYEGLEPVMDNDGVIEACVYMACSGREFFISQLFKFVDGAWQFIGRELVTEDDMEQVEGIATIMEDYL